MRIYNPKLSKAETDAAGHALERRQEAQRQVYLLLPERVPCIRDDGSDADLMELLEEIDAVVERQRANSFHFEARRRAKDQLDAWQERSPSLSSGCLRGNPLTFALLFQ